MLTAKSLLTNSTEVKTSISDDKKLNKALEEYATHGSMNFWGHGAHDDELNFFRYESQPHLTVVK